MTNKKLRFPLFIIVILIAFFISSCVYKVPVEECLTEEPSGFLQGLMHGIILPFQFIISLFKTDLAIYDINNNGNWYNFGFVFGASMILGGGSKATCKKS